MADKTDKTNTPSIAPSPVNITGVTVTVPAIAADRPVKIKPKRLSQSARTYRRRQKQAAHKPAAAGS